MAACPGRHARARSALDRRFGRRRASACTSAGTLRGHDAVARCSRPRGSACRRPPGQPAHRRGAGWTGRRTIDRRARALARAGDTRGGHAPASTGSRGLDVTRARVDRSSGEGDGGARRRRRARGADGPGRRRHRARPHHPQRRRRATPRTGPGSGSTASRGCVVADNRLLDTFFGIYAARSVGLPDHGQQDRGPRRGGRPPPGNGIHLFSSAGFTVARQPDPRASRRHLPRVLPAGHDRRQREPRQPALRPPLHVLRQLRVPAQRVRGKRRRRGGDVQPERDR